MSDSSDLSVPPELNTEFLQSPLALRLGFKQLRILATREFGDVQLERPSQAVPQTLSFALQQGGVTAVSPSGYPILVAPDHTIYSLDSSTETFRPLAEHYDTVHANQWGCVAPAFPDFQSENDPTLASASQVHTGDLSFSAIRQSDLDAFRNTLTSYGDACGFIEGKPHFNATLSHAIHIDDLHLESSFRAIFPDSDDDHTSATAAAKTAAPTSREPGEPGRIILSYRHQNFGAERISLDDWRCAAVSLARIMRLYNWTMARFWTDCLLRARNAQLQTLGRVAWAELGIEPYQLGPVAVLNLSRRPSLSDRFWLTVERRTGAQNYGTWLTDDAGDLFYFAADSGARDGALAVVCSVSTSQGITWAADRRDVLRQEWNRLNVSNVAQALELLNSADAFEARQDFVDEDMDEMEITPEDQPTLKWCGDAEALVDPPSLLEVFNETVSVTWELPIRVIHTKRIVKGFLLIIVVFRAYEAGRHWYVQKRLCVDNSMRIRARSVPRLVDEDFVETLLKYSMAEEIDVENDPPTWLAVSGARIRGWLASE